MRATLFCFVLTLMFAPAAAAEVVDPLEQALDAYAAFELDVSAMSAAQISSPDALDGVLSSAARHDPAALSRGWIAYGALAAAQAPAFVHGLEARVRAAGRAAVLRQLSRDTTYARRRPAGSAQAIALVITTLSGDAQRLAHAADRYDEISGQLELNPAFAAGDPAQRATRDQRLRIISVPSLAPALAARLHIGALAANPLRDPAAFGGAHFWDALADLPSLNLTPTPPRPDRQALIDRMLTLAGLFVVAATPQAETRVNALLDDPTSRACLRVQQLEFRQCLSVTHAGDEDAACLARHGLRNVQGCLSP
jgi:hypothetical protein